MRRYEEDIVRRLVDEIASNRRALVIEGTGDDSARCQRIREAC